MTSTPIKEQSLNVRGGPNRAPVTRAMVRGMAGFAKDNQILVNLVTNVLAMGISMLISLWMTPLLLHTMGFASYGYIGIINNLLAFMTVLTYTLNSMSGRFLTVSLKRDGPEEASKYISSALYANVFAGIILLALIFVTTWKLESIIRIQAGLGYDVRLAFFLSGIAFVLSSIGIIFSTAAYSRNRLEIINGIGILSNAIRAGLVILLFSLFSAHIWHYAIASVFQVSVTVILGFFAFRKLLPQIHFDLRLFRPAMAWELLSSGFFNSVIMLGNVFITQIDLIVGNRYLPAEVVGMYAAILLIPNLIRNIAVALSSAFSPTTMILYSNGDLDKLRAYSNKVVRYCGLMLGWPVAILSGLAIPILQMWLGKDYSSYESTVVLMLLPLTLHLCVSQLYNVQQALNKVKIPATASVLLGVTNLVLAIYFTASLKMGIFGIVLSGVIMSTIRTCLFIPLYTAFITNQRFLAYYKGLITPFIISAATCITGILMQRYVHVRTPLAALVSAVGLSVVYAIIAASVLSREERAGFQRRLLSLCGRLSAISVRNRQQA